MSAPEVEDPLFEDIDILKKNQEEHHSRIVGKTELKRATPMGSKRLESEKPKFHNKWVHIINRRSKQPIFVQKKYWKYGKRILLCGAVNHKHRDEFKFKMEAVIGSNEDTGYILFNKKYGQVYSNPFARDFDGQFIMVNINPDHPISKQFKGKRYTSYFVYYVDKDEYGDLSISNDFHGKLQTGRFKYMCYKGECEDVVSNAFYSRHDSVVKKNFLWDIKILKDQNHEVLMKNE